MPRSCWSASAVGNIEKKKKNPPQNRSDWNTMYVSYTATCANGIAYAETRKVGRRERTFAGQRRHKTSFDRVSRPDELNTSCRIFGHVPPAQQRRRPRAGIYLGRMCTRAVHGWWWWFTTGRWLIYDRARPPDTKYKLSNYSNSSAGFPFVRPTRLLTAPAPRMPNLLPPPPPPHSPIVVGILFSSARPDLSPLPYPPPPTCHALFHSSVHDRVC